MRPPSGAQRPNGEETLRHREGQRIFLGQTWQTSINDYGESENHHFFGVNQLEMVIFNSYVGLPEGIDYCPIRSTI